MQIALEPGRYVVAVSGGVDSVALLHALQAVPGLKLTVAHYDHGIRLDSKQDRLFVQALASYYGLPYVYDEGRLGPGTSEELARKVRYAFLRKVRASAGAQALVTAHHQDDALETAIINILRGTGRKGLTSLRSTDVVKRPLLHVPKAEIIDYARQNGLSWREDSTNADEAYLRNYVRRKLLSRFSPPDRAQLHDLVVSARATNQELDKLLHEYLLDHHSPERLNRRSFIMLPHAVALEVMAAWLRLNGIRNFDRKALERLVHGAKIKEAGKLVDIGGGVWLQVERDALALMSIER